MKKYTIIFIFVSSLFLSGCATSTYTTKDDKIFLNYPNTNKTLITLKFDTNNIEYNNSSCTMNPYTAKQNFNNFGDISIEHIPLNINCEWHGLSRGFYESFIQEKVKFSSMKLIKRFDIENYEFSQYQIDKKYLLNLIFIWDANESTFILDSSGKLTASLLDKLSSSNKLPINDDGIELKFKGNIVEENWYKHYFGKEEKGDAAEKIILY